MYIYEYSSIYMSRVYECNFYYYTHVTYYIYTTTTILISHIIYSITHILFTLHSYSILIHTLTHTILRQRTRRLVWERTGLSETLSSGAPRDTEHTGNTTKKITHPSGDKRSFFSPLSTGSSTPSSTNGTARRAGDAGAQLYR
jgi:hypothetical protein